MRGRTKTAPILLAAASDPIESDALLEHAHVQALLEAACLTGLPAALVYFALSRGGTLVFNLALNSSLEEGLAGLARAQAIVLAASYIATNKAGLLRIDIATTVLTMIIITNYTIVVAIVEFCCWWIYCTRVFCFIQKTIHHPLS